MNIYKIKGLNKTAIAPIRIAIEVLYRDTKEIAFTKFVDVEKLLETVNDLDIKIYVVGRLYIANNVGIEYKTLDDEELELYDLDKLPVYGAKING